MRKESRRRRKLRGTCGNSSLLPATKVRDGRRPRVFIMGWLTIDILLLTIVVLLILAALWLVDSHRAYQEIFADEHFREVTARLPALKRAALERVILSASDAVCTPEDPRGMLTSAGLSVLYLIGREGCWFHHDLSLSWVRRPYTPHAIGNMFLCFLARLLGIGMERLCFRISAKTVHHTAFTLSALEHQQFADRPVVSLSLDELAAFRRHWALSGRMVRWERNP
jgi:hypothetical protein